MPTSPRTSASRSPRRSPKSSSERRRPLHERSDSDTNQSLGPALGRPSEDSVYQKDPFPRLPSQILAPKDAPFIFPDTTATPDENAPIPHSTLERPSAEPEPLVVRSAKEKGKAKASPEPEEKTFIPREAQSFAVSTGARPVFSIADRLKQRLKDGGDRSSKIMPGIGGRKPDQGSSKLPEKEATMSSMSIELPMSIESGNLSSLGRLRAHSSASQLAYAESEVDPEASRFSLERPRSSSVPGAPTDAFLKALVSSGENVQYPQLRKPSRNSLRSESSSTRMAYPPPLRLHRKPGNSRLAETAALDSYQLRGSALDESERGAINQSPFSTARRQQARSLAPSGTWTDELQDTVPELSAPTLRHQYSFVHRDSASHRSMASISSTHSSSQTSVLFYQLDNDSKTNWARAYYRGGEGGIRLATPPHVTNIRNSWRGPMPMPMPMTPRSSSKKSNSVSGPSQSPDSADFPESIYIPRVRPLKGDHSSSDNQWTSVAESESVIAEPGSNERTESLIPGAVQSSEDQSEQIHSFEHHEMPELWTQPPLTQPPLNATPEVPYLARDKGTNEDLSIWPAPSIESQQGALGIVNRQIVLFCVGFVFPLGKLN